MTMSLWNRAIAFGFVAAAAMVTALVTLSYVGGFLNPQGNMKNVPIALVNEDAGATLNGQQVSLGDQIVAQVTAPDLSTGDTIKWTVLSSREQALSKLGEDEFFAAIVIPNDYSVRVAALFDPTVAPAGSAEIEVLTNPAAGSFAGTEAQLIASGVVAKVSAETSAQLTQALTAAGATVAPETAGIFANPVRSTITVAQPIGENSGRGLAPFYFAVMLAIAAYMSVSIVNVAVDFLSGFTHLEFLGARARRPTIELSRLAVWRAKLVLSLATSVVSGVLSAWIVVDILDMDVAKGFQLGLFAILAVAAIAMVTLAFLTAFGQPGLVIAVLFTIIYAVPASGGVYPREMVPDFFRALGWLPLRYIVDGARSLMFFDGRSGAGLGEAIAVLSGYALGAAALGGLTALVLDRFAAHRAPVVELAGHPTAARSTV